MSIGTPKVLTARGRILLTARPISDNPQKLKSLLSHCFQSGKARSNGFPLFSVESELGQAELASGEAKHEGCTPVLG
jgi:hypothetical protein